MRALKTKCFFTLIALAALYPVGSAGQGAATGNDPGTEGSMLRLEGTHQAASCLKQQEINPPVVYAPDNAITSLTYQDQYFKLGCAVSGFKEYFAPSRWAAIKIKGDGGVDVTGAPNSILVEGANRASVIATPGSAASYRIAIPAEGYVSFDWGYIGGSNFFNQQFWIEVNGERAGSMSAERRAGTFFSRLLSPGDELSFNLVSGATGFEVRLSSFEFLSNAIGVIERQWEGRTQDGKTGYFTQLVSIEKPDFTRVIFPGDHDGVNSPAIEGGVSIDPIWTGYPVIDEDGSVATTYDQYPLTDDGCSFGVKWEDEMLYDNGECIIFRQWSVSDYCGGNEQSYTQVIRVSGGCPENGTPLPYGQYGPREKREQQAFPAQRPQSATNTLLQAGLSDAPLSIYAPEAMPPVVPAD